MTQIIPIHLFMGLLFSITCFSPLGTLESYANESCHNCIGILPLKYKGAQKNLALYAQGTQDSLIYALSAVRSLEVEAGQRVGLEYVYTGSLHDADGQLRIFIDRIHIATGQVDFVAQVTGPSQKFFQIQAQIAQKILEKTELAVTAQEIQEVQKNIHVTFSLTAYEHFLSGQVAQKNQNLKQGILDFNKALQIDPKYTLAYHHRGLVYSMLQQYEQAISDFTQALEHNPKYVLAYNHRGIAFANLKQYDQAIANFSKALVLEPTDIVAYNNRGIAYTNLQKYNLAISDFNSVIEHSPKYALAYNNRGIVYANQKQYGLALSDFTRAIALEPNDAEIYYNRGVVYNHLKKYEKAISDYSRSIELSPKYAEAYANRGVAYWQLNMRQKAIESYHKACQLGAISTCDWLNQNI